MGMNKRRKSSSSYQKSAVRFDDQYRFQVDVGYVAARQRAIDLAMVIDEDSIELDIERSPIGVASWNDDWRPPLLW
ncbi:MAG: hypothetical protein ACKO96_09775, partial [Flammeovirgaceae bacterium]